MEPASGAVVAHGSSLKFTVPLTLVLFCVIDTVPLSVLPLADDVTENCQFPVRFGPELLLLLLLPPHPSEAAVSTARTT